MKKLLLFAVLLVGAGMAWGAHKAAPSTAKPKNVASQMERYESGDTIIMQQMPTFQGGDTNKFVAWLSQRVIYPSQAQLLHIQGVVLIAFIVETDGTISTFEVLDSPDELLTLEALRVLKKSPRWEPGRVGKELKNGTVIDPVKPVRVRMTAPLNFTLR